MEEETKRILFAVVAFGCLLTAGCGKHKTLEGQLIEWSDNVSDAARKVVDDPARAAEAGRIAEVIGAELKLFFDEIGLSRVRFERLNADYDAERRDFEALAHEGRSARRARAEEVIRLTMEMRKQMTPEEWSRFVAKTDPPAK